MGWGRWLAQLWLRSLSPQTVPAGARRKLSNVCKHGCCCMPPRFRYFFCLNLDAARQRPRSQTPPNCEQHNAQRVEIGFWGSLGNLIRKWGVRYCFCKVWGVDLG